MKNFKEEIEAMKAQIAALENNLTCGCDECESEEQVVISGKYMNVGADTVVFTKEELIIFAAKLMERTVEACKEAVSDIDIDANYICDLSLNGNNQIEVEIDNRVIRDTVSDEIDNTIELDNDSVEVEVDNILRDMLKQS